MTSGGLGARGATHRMDATNAGRTVSTVIPTYRRPRLLCRAIRSALGQTYPHVWVCIYDNASGDETTAVVQGMMERDARVRYHRHPENIGAYENFQYGLAHVQTGFFSLLSDDDILLPEFYARAIDALDRHPEAGFVIQDVLQLNDGGGMFRQRVMTSVPEGVYGPGDGPLAMLTEDPPIWTGMVFRREVVERVGPLDLGVGAAADQDFVLRAALRFPFVLCHQPGSVFVPACVVRAPGMRGSVSATWPGWRTMVEHVSAASQIPAETRDRIARALRLGLARPLKLSGLAAVLRGEFAQAALAGEVLGSYCERPWLGAFVRVAALACRLLPPLRWLGVGLYHVRRFVRLRAIRWMDRFDEFRPLTQI